MPALAPVFLFKLLLRFFTGERIFHVSIRLGFRKKPFRMLKFATMRTWTPEEFAEYLKKHPGQYREWRRTGKLWADPRTTKIGGFLRRSSLDELPQLWNVVKGEMSLVGPRPISRPEDGFYGRYSRLIHSVRPGMTGLWQVSGRNLTTYRRRVAMNVCYVRHRSWKLNWWILWKTVGAVLAGRGAW